MLLTAKQISLIRQSFNEIVPASAEVADIFYCRLWEIAPETKQLFNKTDMAVQGNKIMELLGIAVVGLSDLDAFVPAVKSLGARHAAYGVDDYMYQLVGEALIWSLEKFLGDCFTPQVKEAWITAYTILEKYALIGAGEVE